MKNFLQKSVAALVFMTLLCAGTIAHAQNGNGAYILRTDRPACIGNSILGVAALNAADCVSMTQTIFQLLPNNRVRVVWVAMLPPNLTPAVKTVYKSFYSEYFNGTTYYYDNSAVAMPDGSLKLTMNGDDTL